MLEVALPVRPNGSTGFVRSSDVSLSTHRARIVVDLGAHRVTAWEEVAEGAVALGANATPTPPGEFYMNEVQEQDDADALFGSWIIGLSGFSETLPLTDRMDPAIVLHGTNDPSLLGTDVSEGYIRMHDDVIARLAQLPAGTPSRSGPEGRRSGSVERGVVGVGGHLSEQSSLPCQHGGPEAHRISSGDI